VLSIPNISGSRAAFVIARAYRHIFACGSAVLADLLVCGFSALHAEKPHRIEKKVHSAARSMRQLGKS
jgi:hypothetical protein